MGSEEIFLFVGVGTATFIVFVIIHTAIHGARKLFTRQTIINALLGIVGGLLLSLIAAWQLGPYNSAVPGAYFLGAILSFLWGGSLLTDKFMPYADEVAEQEEAAMREQLDEETWRRAKAKIAFQLGKVFISYRREDGPQAGRIADYLDNEFGAGHVFIDVESIRAGADFVKAINDEVAKCDVLLALIGHNWLGRTGQRVFDNPKDYVRLEIAAALQRQIRVIPILLDGASMPTDDQLPADLQELTRRNALFLRHVSFKSDMEMLVRELKATKEDHDH